MMLIGIDSQGRIMAVTTIPEGLTTVQADDADFAGKNPLLYKIRTGSNWQEVYPRVLTHSWIAGARYRAGDIVAYGSGLYEVVQAHTSQSDWTPDVVPALFKSTVAEGEIPDWVQPQGAHDAYAKGDKVHFAGKVYESLIAANVWSPAVYPAGWKLVA